MKKWTTYNNLTKEQQEHAVSQYLTIRTIEEEITKEEYLNKYSYSLQDIAEILNEKSIEIDTDDTNYLYVEV